MNEDNVSAVAHSKSLRLSAQKARLVVDLIRGKPVGEAIDVLSFSPQKAARLVLKVLESAIANAEHNAGADVDRLVVSLALADEGPTLKRMKPMAKLYTHRVLKRNCHVTIGVSVKS